MRAFIGIIFCLISANLSAQENLIVNGDCEEYSSCPDGLSDPSQSPYEITKCNGYNAPTKGTSDYFNRCATNWVIDVPSNALGIQEPYSGNGYLGAFLFSVEDGFIDMMSAWWWEYIEGTITIPLQAGQNYRFSCYISVAEFSSVGINEIGVYFSDTQIQTSNVYPLDTIVPQIVFSDLADYKDTLNWLKLEGEFIATGGEKYFTIGNYKNAPETNYVRRINRDSDSLKTYIYFDDLFLAESENIPVFPNVFTPNYDGVNDYIDFSNYLGKKIYIINRWGSTVLLINEQSNYLWFGKNYFGEDLPDGVYYYLISDTNIPEEKIYGTIYLTR